jgi:MFS family permease
VLRLGYFRVFLVSAVFNMFAMSMQQVAQGYLAYTLGNSAVALGAVTMAVGVTMLPTSFIAGAIADRFEKRMLILVTRALAAAISLSIAVLIATGRIEIWHLIVASLLQGAVQPFTGIAQQSLMPELVGKDLLPQAMPLASLGGNASRIIGPSIAGVLIGIPLFGIHGTFFLISAALLLSAFLTFWLPRSTVSQIRVRETLFGSIASGVRYVRLSPALLLLIVMSFVPAMVSMPAQSLLPVFNDKVLSGTVETLGLLHAAAAFGTLGGSIALMWIGRSVDTAKHQILLAIGLGLAVASLGLVRDFQISFALYFAVGFCFQAFLTLNMTAVLATSAPEFSGRIMSLHILGAGFPTLVTLPLAGLADNYGISMTLGVLGSCLVIIMLLTGFFGRSRLSLKARREVDRVG